MTKLLLESRHRDWNLTIEACADRRRNRYFSSLISPSRRKEGQTFREVTVQDFYAHHSSANREQIVIAIRSSKLAMDWLRLRVDLG